MTEFEGNEAKLEELIGYALRAQGRRRAPQDLQARVFAEIARRAALPWWRNSFGHWPVTVRLGFLIASYGFVRLALATAMWPATLLHSAQVASFLDPAERWMHGPASMISAAIDVAAAVVRTVPPGWLFGAVFTALALYTMLFGLGATAYRTLYIKR